MKKNIARSHDSKKGCDFKFDEQQRKEIQKIINDNKFITELENIIRDSVHRNGWLEEISPGRTKFKDELNGLKIKLRSLNTSIEDITFGLASIMQDIMEREMGIHPSSGDIPGKLQLNLYSFLELIEKTEQALKQQPSLGRKHNDTSILICGEIKKLLIKRGIKPTSYRGGAWCKLTELALESINMSVDDPLNSIRQRERNRKKERAKDKIFTKRKEGETWLVEKGEELFIVKKLAGEEIVSRWCKKQS